MVLVVAGLVPLHAQPSAAPACATAPACVQMAEDAIAQSEFERAHDLAWRAVQLGRANDTTLMFLLARAQSLSGRPHDALVMLRRMTALGFRSTEIETLEDFRRVRNLPGWTDVQAELVAAAPAAAAASKPAPADKRATRDKPSPPAKATSPAGADSAEKNATPDKPAAPPPPAAPDVKASANAAERPASKRDEAAAAEVVGPSLRVAVTPYALAYDGVSARFVVADESSDTLKVVDERTGNVIDLVAHGWAGSYRPAALAIDARRGELWVAAVDAAATPPHSTIYKLQLVSGRLLETIALPNDLEAITISDIAVGRDGVFALDAAGRRVFALRAGAKARVAASLATLTRPVSIAAAGDSAIYVAHEHGLARIDLSAATRIPTPVPMAADIGELQSIAWHDGSLFAIERAGGAHKAIRLRLNARGTTATSVNVLGPAASRAGGVYDGAFYYVVPERDGVLLRGARPR